MNRAKSIFAVTSLSLALAFTLSCSDDGGNSHCNSEISYGTLSHGGRDYKTVKICSQIWMAENLDYDVPGNTADVCYDNNSGYCNIYGRLYDWETAKIACPSGWHIPSESELDMLMTTVGGFDFAGTKLKATSGWDYDGNSTDDYGFSAMPGGYGYPDGSFSGVGGIGYWWMTSEAINDVRNGFRMESGSEDVSWFVGKTILMSVRCIKD